MKRHVSEQIDWTKCVVCQSGDGELRSTSQGIESLANQFKAWWNDKILPFDAAFLTSHTITDEEGKIYPDFKSAMATNSAKYHHNCKNNFSEFKMNKKLTSATKRLKVEPNIKAAERPMRGESSALKSLCIICNKYDDIQNMCAAGSWHATKSKLSGKHVSKLTEQWREMARVTNDDGLVSRLAIGDLGANSSFYHKICYTGFYNRYREQMKCKTDTNKIKEAAWDKVIAYIAESDESNGYDLNHIESMYIDYLAKYNVFIKSHSSRFAKELLERASDLMEIVKEGRKSKVFLKEMVFDIVNTFGATTMIDRLRSIVQPIRKDVFDRKHIFDGTLNYSQQNSMSPTLLALISMLVDGEYNEDARCCSQAVLIICGMITYNTREVKNNNSLQTQRRHNRDRETPFNIYIGLKLYSTIRSRTIIDHLFNLGISISYDRILSITKSVYEGICENYSNYGVFVPQNLKKGGFMVLVKDNIDKNASANLIQSHYHGTSITLVQFLDDSPSNNSNQDFSIDYIDKTHSSKKLTLLPAEYTNPSHVNKSKLSGDLYAPLCCVNFEDTNLDQLEEAMNDEFKWASQFAASYDQNKSWAQYHINNLSENSSNNISGENALLPLIRDKINTIEMQCHTMELNIKSVNVVNPGQTPVDVSDCPIYALTKEVIYRFPERFSNYVAMFGGLHIEQCLLVVHGQLIENSGLKEILQSCSLATIGAGSVVDVNHIKRARYCMQVLLCAMYRKLASACSNEGDDSHIDPQEWLTDKAETNSMCRYLKIVLDLQAQILSFVRSIREGNFILYVQSLRSILKWFFILDHYNYARWLTVHVFDMMNLHITNPDVYTEMQKGSFSYAKSQRPFSRMALDQLHEQNNKLIKGLGGASNILNQQDESALIRWGTCGSEITRIISEFEESSVCSNLKHHEDNEAFRSSFCKDVDAVSERIASNPFQLETLTTINNKDCIFPKAVTDELENILEIGECQVLAFIYDRLVFQKVPISSTIKKNKFLILNIPQSKETAVNVGIVFMNKLRSAVNERPMVATELFESEIYGIPACFSVDYSKKMYHGTKSSIQDRLYACSSSTLDVNECTKNVVIVEASPLFRKLSGANVNNFHEFALVFYNQVRTMSKGFFRLDVVFDRYFDNSLKAQTRYGRGIAGTRISNINDDTVFPKDFLSSFLCNSANKNDLGKYMGSKLISLHVEYSNSFVLCVTMDDSILSSPNTIEPSTIGSTAEEADQKLVKHVLHCIDENYKKIVVHSIDTDVLVLLIGYVAHKDVASSEIFFNMMSIDKTLYNIVENINILGPAVAKALPFFYALTGCDVNPSFNGKGKCTFFDAWMKSEMKDEITSAFMKLGNMPDEIRAEEQALVETLVKTVYFGSKYNRNKTLNMLRKDQFIQLPSNDLRKLAPSSDALYMQTLRATHIAGFEWQHCNSNIIIPAPLLRGYTLNHQTYEPQWLSSENRVDVLNKLITTCKCKTAKCLSCKCAALQLKCLPICHCNQLCVQK